MGLRYEALPSRLLDLHPRRMTQVHHHIPPQEVEEVHSEGKEEERLVKLILEHPYQARRHQ